MFWKRKKRGLSEYCNQLDEVAVSHRNLALKKLDGDLPPTLLAYFWALAFDQLRRQGERVEELTFSDQEKFAAHAEESFLLHAMAGFGSMGPNEIEEATGYLKSCVRDVVQLNEGIFAAGGIQKAFREWTTSSDLGKQVLLDDRIGPIALLCGMSITEQLVKWR